MLKNPSLACALIKMDGRLAHAQEVLMSEWYSTHIFKREFLNKLLKFRLNRNLVKNHILNYYHHFCCFFIFISNVCLSLVMPVGDVHCCSAMHTVPWELAFAQIVNHSLRITLGQHVIELVGRFASKLTYPLVHGFWNYSLYTLFQYPQQLLRQKTFI